MEETALREKLAAAAAAFAGIVNLAPEILQASALIVTSLKAGGKILLCGNGGSAGDAQHVAAEFLGRFLRERRALPAIALTTNTSAITAIGNDYHFDEIFARQVAAFGKKGDVLIGISTSGKSRNVIRALEVAGTLDMVKISLTGAAPGEMAACSDLTLAMPSPHTPRVQEMHICVAHFICEYVELAFVDGRDG